jgi:RimJ/RimL family protein N-acetyltransferase
MTTPDIFADDEVTEHWRRGLMSEAVAALLRLG